MRTPLQRIRLGAVVLAGVFVIAVVGYRLQGRSWIDALYMVVITIATVGFGERPHSSVSTTEKVLTISVILIGITASVYTLGGFLQMMAQGEVDRALSRRRLTRGIERLKDHVVICGFGRVGQQLAASLASHHQPFVVIDQESDLLTEARDLDYLIVAGDATEEEVLVAAGILTAKTLVTALPSDAANVFITLTARNLNRDLYIIARGELLSTESKLRQAGADRVVLPATIGAQRMATLITHPSTADLMELVSDPSILEVKLDEVFLPSGNRLVGVTVEQTEARRRHQLLIVAIKQADGTMIFNPDADYLFSESDTAIVMGRQQDIARFRDEYGL